MLGGGGGSAAIRQYIRLLWDTAVGMHRLILMAHSR